jgi:hypothetical protein
MRIAALVIEARMVEGDMYDGYRVFFNDQPAYWRPYDGSSAEQVEGEAAAVLGELVRKKLGHPKERRSG